MLLAAGAIGLGALYGLVAVRATLPLFGRGSIGEHAAYAGAATSGIAAIIAGYRLTPQAQPWFARIGRLRRGANILGLAALHAVFSLLLVSAVFAVFASAFRGVALDHVAGTVWVALACGICTYVAVTSVSTLTTQSLTVLLSVFVLTGVLVSAISSPDPHWWEHHFSFLGADDGGSGIAFNLTLLLTGIALTTIGDFLAHDVETWARATGEPAWKARTVRLTMLLLGVLVMLVALIPVTLDRRWHDASAQGIVVVFALVLVVFPLLFRRLSGAFLVATGVVLGLLVALLVLWEGVGYLNVTAFEMGAAATVFAWLLLFIRTVGVAVDGVREADPAAGERQTA